MARITAAVFLSLFLTPAVGAAAEIERVDPPFWYRGFAETELQLMVYGGGIADYAVKVSGKGVSLLRTERGDSGNYLFVYVDIAPTAASGYFELELRDGNDMLRHRYELKERNAAPEHNHGFDGSDVIYLITPDRFANGDTTNDTIAGYRDKPNRNDDYGRHGGDLAGIYSHLDYIASMGFTAIWLNPVLENAMPEASYHGYATTDFYAVDPRFGDRREYRQLVQAARKMGVGTIMDMIVNHIGSEHPWMADPPTHDWINSDGQFKPTSHARTTHQDPYASDYDKQQFTDGWFVATMPDLNQRNDLLGDYLVQNAIWWTEYLGLAGIRQDTYPYPDKNYMSEWTRRIMQEFPALNIVGEEWSPNPAVVSYWQAGKSNHDGYISHLPSVMDFPLQIAFANALTADEPSWGSVWTPVYEMLGSDFLYADPFNLVIFADNHDMSRIYTQVNENIDRFRMAMVFYLTMRGIPQIYYGTEILMAHPGTESHGAIRRDFPGGWADDEVNAFSGAGLAEDARDAQAFVRRLLQWRRGADVIHNGKLMQFAPTGNVYAYSRYDDDDTVIVIFNRGDAVARASVEQLAERIGSHKSAIDIVSGSRIDLHEDIELAPQSVLLLELQ